MIQWNWLMLNEKCKSAGLPAGDSIAACLSPPHSEPAAFPYTFNIFASFYTISTSFCVLCMKQAEKLPALKRTLTRNIPHRHIYTDFSETFSFLLKWFLTLNTQKNPLYQHPADWAKKQALTGSILKYWPFKEHPPCT